MSEISKKIVDHNRCESPTASTLKMDLVIKDIWLQGVEAGLKHAKQLYKESHSVHNEVYLQLLEDTEINWSQP